MLVSLTKLLAVLLLSVSVISSPTIKSSRTIEQRKLKQATRDGIIARGLNPLRRQTSTSCGTCVDCCPGYCTMSGQVQHAAYANTDLPSGGGLYRSSRSTQTSLDACIRQCCAIATCYFALYDSSLTTLNCGTFSSLTTNPTFTYPTTNTPGKTLVANRVTCADNAQAAGNRACCNAPLIPA